MLMVCSWGLFGSDAGRLVPAGWEKSEAARNLIEEVIEARNKLLVSKNYYGTEKTFIIDKILKANSTDGDLKYSITGEEKRRIRDLRTKCIGAAAKVDAFLVASPALWTVEHFYDLFTGSLWEDQKEVWQILTQENLDTLKNSFIYINWGDFPRDLEEEIGWNLKKLEEGIATLVEGPNLPGIAFNDLVEVGGGTLWGSHPYWFVSPETIKRDAQRNIDRDGRKTVSSQATYARKILSVLAEALPAGKDLGVKTAGSYSWESLIAWYKAVVPYFHPDHPNLVEIRRGDYNGFFNEMRRLYNVYMPVGSYRKNKVGFQEVQWQHFKLPVSGNPSHPLANSTKADQYVAITFHFLDELYKIAMPTSGKVQQIDRDVIEFCNIVLSLNAAVVHVHFDQAQSWKLPLKDARKYAQDFESAAEYFKKISDSTDYVSSLSYNHRNSLQACDRVLKNLGHFFQIYTSVLMLNNVDSGGSGVVQHSLFEIASSILGRSLSSQKAMFDGCSDLIVPEYSFATKEQRRTMKDVSGMMRFFLDEDGFSKMRMVYKGLLGLDDPKLQEVFEEQSKEDIQKDLKFKVFGIGDGSVGSGDFLQIFTYAKLQEFISALHLFLFDAFLPNPNISMKSLMLRKYQASWKKEGVAWASQAAFEADVDLLNQSLMQVLNFLQGYCVLISQDPIPVVIRNGKDGQPMKVVKEVSPAVQQAVKLCQADVEFLKVVTFLGKDADGALWITKSPGFSNFYSSYVHTGKWATNFVGDMNAGTMIVDPRLSAVRRVAAQAEGMIKAQLGDDAQFFEFFVQDFGACTDLYVALPAASPSPSGAEGGTPAPGSSGPSSSTGGDTSDGYSMPGNVAAALAVAQEKYDALAAFDWSHAGVALRRINAQLYKKFAGQVALIQKGDPVTVTKDKVQSKGLDKVGDNAEIKAWLDAWMALLDAVEHPAASGGTTGSSGATGDKAGRLLVELNQSLQLVASVA